MLGDIQKEILENIQLELENSDNIQKIQGIIKQIIDYFLKPFQYSISTIAILIILIFIMTIFNTYMNYTIYLKKESY